MSNFILNNIDTSFESYAQLIKLYNEHESCFIDTIDVSIYKWFSANMCSALGGILDKLTLRLNEIRFSEITSTAKVIMQKNDFLSYYGYPRIIDNNNTTIKYLKLKPTDGRYFHGYIVNELLNRPELPQMTSELKKKISESIYEIFVNAQIHSETDFIYTCGQFFPSKHIIEFTITDVGIGFKNRINKRFNKNLNSIQAIKWATSDGHSTKTNISGGIGLALLKEFITKNNGKFQIISDDGFYQYESIGEKLKLFPESFPGTIVNLQFRTDDTSSYSLREEHNNDGLF